VRGKPPTSPPRSLKKLACFGSSSGETLRGRVITALKSQALLNESVGSGYLERKWPPALKESGAWPLTSLRQSFLNGSLTRLLDPDTVLRNKIVEFVSRGDFGLASEQRSDGSYERVWFEKLIGPEEVAFEAGVFLLTKEKAQAYKEGQKGKPEPPVQPIEGSRPEPGPPVTEPPTPGEEREEVILRVKGTVPPELWNRLGTKVLPKLRSGKDLGIGIEFRVGFSPEMAKSVKAEIRQILQDLGVASSMEVE